MKWKDIFSSGAGTFLLYFAWNVLSSGRVLTRNGYTSMTKESNPLAFWFEVGALAVVGAALLAYGLASLLGYSNVTIKLHAFADRFPVLRFQILILYILLVMLAAAVGWLVFDELMRTSHF